VFVVGDALTFPEADMERGRSSTSCRSLLLLLLVCFSHGAGAAAAARLLTPLQAAAAVPPPLALHQGWYLPHSSRPVVLPWLHAGGALFSL
jgi:hypothetical protein